MLVYLVKLNLSQILVGNYKENTDLQIHQITILKIQTNLTLQKLLACRDIITPK